MTNFSIQFEYPWLLLLLIPAVFFTLFFYFRRNKKYRRTRNRITSIVLHTMVMVLCILTLSGVSFSYEKANLSNEVILLVDVTDSSYASEEQRNEFIQDVIAQSDKMFKIGVVTFGYDQVYAVPLTDNVDYVFTEYLHSLEENPPDTTATNIASALNYASGLFTNPETGKIVLVSDGIETDGSALAVVKNIVSTGIKVDTVFFPSVRENEVQLVDIKVPDYSLSRGKEFELGLTLQSDYEGDAFITLHDYYNEMDTEFELETIQLTKGVQEISFPHSFDLTGLHRISFEIKSEQDTELNNNSYYTYIDFKLYNKLLIIEREEGLSGKLVDVLNEKIGSVVNGVEQPAYDVTVVDINSDLLPRTLKELRDYDQVILNNIANADMPGATDEFPAFEEILYSYVHDIGGGLFTISGSKVDEATNQTVANAFTREDMFGSLYQDLLPVQAINYTPPIGLVIIIDRSGSMADTTNVYNRVTQSYYTKLELAKEGAKSCLDALSERDYVGVMSLEDYYSTDTDIIPRTMENTIVNAIEKIQIGGGTVYSGAIKAAGMALKNLGDAVEKKHVFLVSDGEPGDTYEEYSAIIKDNLNSGITFSAITIGASSANAQQLKTACEEDGGGRYYDLVDSTELIKAMRDELQVKEIKDIEQRDFTPKINDHTSIVAGINQEDMPKLGGFYGTKKKEGADVPLMGEFVPIYAQWKHGEGTVGSFLCDLTGEDWSRAFMNSPTGKNIIYNIVDALFATKDIDDKGLDVYLNEGNYTSEMSVIFTDEGLKDDQSLTITVTGDPADGSAMTQQVITRTASEDLSRIAFNTLDAGLYTIKISIIESDGYESTSYTIYKAFSYSAEYDVFVDNESCQLMLAKLAENGKGAVIPQDDAVAVFDSFVKTVTKTFDPTITFAIIAIVLFLLDVAVRKFKFKWLSEIIRDRKAKKQLNNQTQGGKK